MLTLWHVDSMGCRCVLSCVGRCCVCVPLVSIEACSVGVSGVSGVSRVSSVGVSVCLDTYLTPLTLCEEVHCRDGLTLA